MRCEKLFYLILFSLLIILDLKMLSIDIWEGKEDSGDNKFWVKNGWSIVRCILTREGHIS